MAGVTGVQTVQNSQWSAAGIQYAQVVQYNYQNGVVVGTRNSNFADGKLQWSTTTGAQPPPPITAIPGQASTTPAGPAPPVSPSSPTVLPGPALPPSIYPTLELIDRRVGQAELGLQAVLRLIGPQAFRTYNGLTNTIGLNRAGNFRGIVVSAESKTLFGFVSDVDDLIGNVGYFASLAAGIAEAAPDIEKIVESTDSRTMKTLEILFIARTIALRTLIGVVPDGVHMIYRSLEGWLMLIGLAGGTAQTFASAGISTLHDADTLVRTTFQMLTDTTSQARALWSVIKFQASPRAPLATPSPPISSPTARMNLV
jgi:hypothetical protein